MGSRQRNHSRGRRWWLAVALLLFAVRSSLTVAEPAEAEPVPPNLVVIITDDQRWDTIVQRYPELMPNVSRLASEGTYFPNAFVPNSLCCPSRASTLTGTYSHTNGVFGNTSVHGERYGGFDAFHDSVTIATALRDADYRTLFVGKYMNGYPHGHWNYVPPGWNRWFAIRSGAYYRYRAATDGHKSQRFGEARDDYSGRVLTSKAIDYVSRVPEGQPFFLYYAPTAPHSSSPESQVDPGTNNPDPDPRDVGALADMTDWRPASYGNHGVTSGSPSYIQEQGWSREEGRNVDLARQRQLEALIGADREIGKLVASLPPNTAVLFMSDNGRLWGEHRYHSKKVPYEEAIRIPMVLWGPDVGVAAAVDDRLALNIDVAPTLLQLARLPSTVATAVDHYEGNDALVPAEGLSLVGHDVREYFPLEHWDPAGGVPGYCGVRTADGWMYVRYADAFSPSADDGFEELYDLNVDPLEMDNLVDDPDSADMLQELHDLAESLCQPVPPHYSW